MKPIECALASDIPGTEAAIAVLLDHGASLGSPLLDNAVRGNDAAVAKLLASHRGAAAAADEAGRTALHWAVMSGRKSTVRLLLKHKADPNASSRTVGTALHAAAAGGHQGIVAMLLAAGAGINARNQRQETALHLAAGAGDLEITRLLLAHRTRVGLFTRKADVDSENSRGWSPLHCAVQRGNSRVIEALLAAGAGANAGGAEINDCIKGELAPQKRRKMKLLIRMAMREKRMPRLMSTPPR